MNKGLITNKTDLKVFDVFNMKYGLQAISLCPELEHISINAVYNDNSSDKTPFNDYDAFGFYFNYLTESKYAEIIINKEVCAILHLTEMEMLAAIAHELGHIRYTEAYQTSKQGQVVEIDSDDFACKLGLCSPLSSLLVKLIVSGLLPEELIQMTRERLLFLSINSAVH